jgi:hypothetical protein
MRRELLLLPLVVTLACSEIVATGRFHVDDAAVSRDGGMDIDAQVDSGGVVVDSGPDADLDAGPPPCDLLTQTGCPSGSRCVPNLSGGGSTECVLTGTTAIDDACTREADGSDDCVAGSSCLGSVCQAFCEPGPAACSSGHVCVAYTYADDGLFHACLPSCDPVAQDDCSGTEGCNGSVDGPFVCGPPGPATNTQGVLVDPPIFFNSCASGFHPYFLVDGGGGSARCSAFCSPIESYMGHLAGIGGAPNACGDRGAAGLECRFLGAFQTEWNEFGNIIGVCVDPTERSLPDCGSLPNTDTDADGIPQHVQYGCGPRMLR